MWELGNGTRGELPVEYNTFTAGVGPGGLRTKNDICVLLCYLLASVSAPLKQEDILAILQEYDLANYFEVMDAISDLLEKGLIVRQKDAVTVTKEGREIAAQLW